MEQEKKMHWQPHQSQSTNRFTPIAHSNYSKFSINIHQQHFHIHHIHLLHHSQTSKNNIDNQPHSAHSTPLHQCYSWLRHIRHATHRRRRNLNFRRTSPNFTNSFKFTMQQHLYEMSRSIRQPRQPIATCSHLRCKTSYWITFNFIESCSFFRYSN